MVSVQQRPQDQVNTVVCRVDRKWWIHLSLRQGYHRYECYLLTWARDSSKENSVLARVISALTAFAGGLNAI